MIWTVVTVHPIYEKVEHHVFNSFAHDGSRAYAQAQEALPNYIILALIRGNHETSTYVPNKTVQLAWQ